MFHIQGAGENSKTHTRNVNFRFRIVCACMFVFQHFSSGIQKELEFNDKLSVIQRALHTEAMNESPIPHTSLCVCVCVCATTGVYLAYRGAKLALNLGSVERSVKI